MALDDPSLVWEAWEEPSVFFGITDLAARRAGIVKCMAPGATWGSVYMDIAPGNAWIAADIGTNSRESLAFTRSLLPGQISTEDTFTDCADTGDAPCTAVFSLGSAVIEVTGSAESLAVAEAVTALAR
ncbi:hypothetical protein JF66_15465 [Cryobacterium sp. MLB-32]|uniref:hypothetical protein n=1 Tax=Cryobacterium sp. MLB-32 TaxID=1529318 RepID=UPI0004E754CF|nr:hypothetical protein [Cryobacterium sp. MLB-32]KFF58850.1 hypothetical protein JF66_15465 [Cryobacterium sp. MLB-32]